MLQVYITGQIKNKKKVEKFSLDCLEHFFKHRIKRDIDIDIRVTKSHSDNSHGGCYGDHTHVVLEIAKGCNQDGNYHAFDYKEIIVTIAHELVHAKQHIRRERIDVLDAESEAYQLEYDLYDMYWD